MATVQQQNRRREMFRLMFESAFEPRIRRRAVWQVGAAILGTLALIDWMQVRYDKDDASSPPFVLVALTIPIKWITTLWLKLLWLSMLVNEGAMIVFDGDEEFDVLFLHIVLWAASAGLFAYSIVGFAIFALLTALATFSVWRLLFALVSTLGIFVVLSPFGGWWASVIMYNIPFTFRIRRSPPLPPVDLLVWRRVGMCQIHNPAQLPPNVIEFAALHQIQGIQDAWPMMGEGVPRWILIKLSQQAPPPG